jgi:two-component system, OmpR family, sensor kinase
MLRKRPPSVRKSELDSFNPFSGHALISVFVFVLMIILVFFSWRTSINDIQKLKRSEINQRSLLVLTTIEQRFGLFESALRAASGFVAASLDVTPEEWKQFGEELAISERYPGVLSLGFAVQVDADTMQLKTDKIPLEIFASKEVYPAETKQAERTVTLYLQPLTPDNEVALGFDMNSEDARHQAIAAAGAEGVAKVTSPIELVRREELRRSGVIMYYPVYNETNTTIIGYVYIPLLIEELFSGILEDDPSDATYSVAMHNLAGEQNIIYENGPSVASGFDSLVSVDKELYGQNFSFVVAVNNSIIQEGVRTRPATVAFGGSLLALVLGLIVYLLLQRRARLLHDIESEKIQLAKDEMLSLASHQLRTPATGVKQYIGMVLEGFMGGLSKQQEVTLRKAYESNERQLSIINEFLYLAKVDANRIVVSPQVFNLSDLASSVVNDLQSEIQAAKHTLIFSKKKNVLAYADTHSARMIIENLLSNAIKYTPEKGTIRVALTEEGTTCSVRIRDSGVGIDKSDQDKLFKQFSRIQNPLSKMRSGSGIGLYLAKHLAERNGGYISVQSQPGKGSIFSLTLPSKNVKNRTDS